MSNPKHVHKEFFYGQAIAIFLFRMEFACPILTCKHKRSILEGL